MTQQFPQTSRSLPIALLRARERVMGPIRGVLAGAGITEQQWRVLRVLREDGPQEPTRIAEKACLLLPSLTRILQKLEQKHLIVRNTDPNDRRRQVIRTTSQGAQLIADNSDATLAKLMEFRERLGAEKHEMLLDLLNELYELEPDRDH